MPTKIKHISSSIKKTISFLISTRETRITKEEARVKIDQSNIPTLFRIIDGKEEENPWGTIEYIIKYKTLAKRVKEPELRITPNIDLKSFEKGDIICISGITQKGTWLGIIH
ncbi:hypothetical protein HOC80_05430 [archaeon]|jgi:hypothetical protein|nr:hypothetical protein [archaeon]MBT4417514.1 hypothetical protein [archaeon]